MITNGPVYLYLDALANKEPFADANLRRELVRRLNVEASLGLDESIVGGQPPVDPDRLAGQEEREGFL